jgi:hypothetical protein
MRLALAIGSICSVAAAAGRQDPRSAGAGGGSSWPPTGGPSTTSGSPATGARRRPLVGRRFSDHDGKRRRLHRAGSGDAIPPSRTTRAAQGRRFSIATGGWRTRRSVSGPAAEGKQGRLPMPSTAIKRSRAGAPTRTARVDVVHGRLLPRSSAAWCSFVTCHPADITTPTA